MEVETAGVRVHRRGKILFNHALRAVLVLGILVLANLIARTHYLRMDLTELQELSLTGATKKVLHNLDDIVAIRAYFSAGIPNVFKSHVDEVRELLHEYRANGTGNVRLEFQDPSADPSVEDFVKGLGIEAGRFQTIRKDRRAVEMLYAAVGVFYRDRHDTINLASYDPSSWARVLEYELTRIIVDLTRGRSGSLGMMAEVNPPPKRGEKPASRNPQFSELREQLLKQRKVVQVDLRGGKPVPEGVDTLLVARPAGLSEGEKYEIDQFLMRGGKVLFLVDRYGPSPASPSQAQEIDTNLLDMLEHYGVAVEPGLVKDTRCNQLTVQRPIRTRSGKVVGAVPVPVRYPYALRVTKESLDRTNPMVSAVEAISFLWASPLRLVPSQTVGKRVFELASSSRDSWVEAKPESLAVDTETPEAPVKAETGERLLAAALVGKFDSFYAGKEIPRPEEEEGEDAGDETTSKPEGDSPAAGGQGEGITIPESPTTRILVVGDADFVSDAVARSQGQSFLEGLMFVLNAVDWFTVRSELIEIRSRGFVDRSLRDVSDAGRRWAKLANIAGMPGLVVLAGILRFLTRGRGRGRRRARRGPRPAGGSAS